MFGSKETKYIVEMHTWKKIFVRNSEYVAFRNFFHIILVVHRSDKKHSANRLLGWVKSYIKQFIFLYLCKNRKKMSLKLIFLNTWLNSSKGYNQICGSEPWGNGNSARFMSNPLFCLDQGSASSTIPYCNETKSTCQKSNGFSN